ncbi:hypothetical protein CTI14_53010, partial [Methylobacterium radiotolerans]
MSCAWYLRLRWLCWRLAAPSSGEPASARCGRAGSIMQKYVETSNVNVAEELV